MWFLKVLFANRFVTVCTLNLLHYVYSPVLLKILRPIQVAARFKAWVCAAHLLRLWVLIPPGGMNVCL